MPTYYSTITYPNAGGGTTFAIPFGYLEQSHLFVYADGALQVNGTDYNINTGTQDVVFVSSVPAGYEVIITRDTPIADDDLVVTFQDGSGLTASDLNNSQLQSIYALQERDDQIVELQTENFDNISPLTTKGDLVVHGGATNTRLPVGTNNYFLQAASAQSSGVKWSNTLSSPIITGQPSFTQFSGFEAYNSSNQTEIAASTYTQLVAPTKGSDYAAEYDATNSVWVLNAAGRYVIWAQVGIASAAWVAGEYVRLALLISPTGPTGPFSPGINVPAQIRIQASGTYALVLSGCNAEWNIPGGTTYYVALGIYHTRSGGTISTTVPYATTRVLWGGHRVR